MNNVLLYQIELISYKHSNFLNPKYFFPAGTLTLLAECSVTAQVVLT